MVARAVRLRIRLHRGAQLVGILGSEPLDAQRTERTRQEDEVAAPHGRREDRESRHAFRLDDLLPGRLHLGAVPVGALLERASCALSAGIPNAKRNTCATKAPRTWIRPAALNNQTTRKQRSWPEMSSANGVALPAQPIHVLQLLQGLNIGGIERMAASLVHGLDPTEFSSSFCTFDWKGKLAGELQSAGFDIHHRKRRGGVKTAKIVRKFAVAFKPIQSMANNRNCSRVVIRKLGGSFKRHLGPEITRNLCNLGVVG